MPAHVLIVDDHAESRQMMEMAATLAGHAHQAAANASEAMQRCREARFDCMLLDEVLGEDSGLELAESLHGQALRPRRIVIVSGLSPEMFESARRDGVVDEILEKPVRLEELLAAIGG